MKNGQLFPIVRDRYSRRGIYQHIINIKGRIPSLLLFIEDTKYLEALVKALKSLFPIIINKTLQFSIYKSYSRNAKAKIKLAKGSFHTIKVSQTVTFSITYKTMWLAAICHSLQLTRIPCLKDKEESKLEAIISEHI